MKEYVRKNNFEVNQEGFLNENAKDFKLPEEDIWTQIRTKLVGASTILQMLEKEYEGNEEMKERIKFSSEGLFEAVDLTWKSNSNERWHKSFKELKAQYKKTHSSLQ